MSDPIFWFDYGSPNAYLSHRVIPEIETRTGARFTYVPVLLGGIFKMTGNQAPNMAFANIPHKLAYENKELQRFVARHGLNKYRFNPHFPVNTLLMMRITAGAEMDGGIAEVAEVFFRAMWEDGLKMDDPAIVGETLAAAGFPAEKLMARAQDQEVKGHLLANTQSAYEKGVFGIPSFLVGDEMFFGKDRLREVEEMLEAVRR